MSIDWDQIAKDHMDQQPHPLAPSLLIGEFATAVKLASMAKFGGHASPHEAALIWPEFKATGMSSEEFEQTLDRIAPLSFAYHGRPPTMREIAQFRDKQPHEARKYFGDLPDKHYPTLSASEMVRSLTAAKPWAQQHLGRDPLKNESAYLHHSGEHPSAYYARLAAQSEPQDATMAVDEPEAQVGTDAGGRRMAPAGRPQANQ